MGHRQFFNTFSVLDNDRDQDWNRLQTEQHYMCPARASAAESGSLTSPVESIAIHGRHVTDYWNPASARPNSDYVYSYNSRSLQYQSDVPRPYRGPSLHPSVFSVTPEIPVQHSSASSYTGSAIHEITDISLNCGMNIRREHSKRKNPGYPASYEEGSTSRHYRLDNSSHVSIPPGFHHRTCIVSIDGENALRNVRSRSGLDLGSNPAWNHSFSSLPMSAPYPAGQFHGHPVSLHPSTHWNLSTDPEFYQVHNPSRDECLPSSSSHVSGNAGRYCHGMFTSRTHPVSWNMHASAEGSRSAHRFYHDKRPTCLAASRSLHLGNEGSYNASMRLDGRYPIWQNGVRPGRSCYERIRPFSSHTGIGARWTSQGLAFVDRASYRDRNVLDQHNDMRLDTDNMTYEELLALGERIGNVSTGLSDVIITECLMKIKYHPSDCNQGQKTCAICLEDYKEDDEVGTIKRCGHDYHVVCIRKWLSMKNSCPVCKASVGDGKAT